MRNPFSTTWSQSLLSVAPGSEIMATPLQNPSIYRASGSTERPGKETSEFPSIRDEKQSSVSRQTAPHP